MKKEFMEQLINNCKSEIEQYIESNGYKYPVDLLDSIEWNKAEILIRVWNGTISFENILRVEMKQEGGAFQLRISLGSFEENARWLNSSELDTSIKPLQYIIINKVCCFIEGLAVREK